MAVMDSDIAAVDLSLATADCSNPMNPKHPIGVQSYFPSHAARNAFHFSKSMQRGECVRVWCVCARRRASGGCVQPQPLLQKEAEAVRAVRAEGPAGPHAWWRRAVRGRGAVSVARVFFLASYSSPHIQSGTCVGSIITPSTAVSVVARACTVSWRCACLL